MSSDMASAEPAAADPSALGTPIAGPLAGGCICGAVRFTAYGIKPALHACHCPLCQKWGGGPFIGMEAEKVEFADGAPIGVFQSSEWAERVFCKECGTNLVWRLHDGTMPAVAAAALDEMPAGAVLESELYIDTKPDGYALAGDHKRLTRREVELLFGGEG